MNKIRVNKYWSIEFKKIKKLKLYGHFFIHSPNFQLIKKNAKKDYFLRRSSISSNTIIVNL